MPGTWETQNKVLPGAYINLITNTPLSVTAGSRGVVVIPLKGRFILLRRQKPIIRKEQRRRIKNW